MRRRKASGPGARSTRGARRVDQLGQRIGAEASSPPTACLSVYDGRRCIGFLMLRGRQRVATFNADERSLGIFPDTNAAVGAITTGA